MKYGIYFAYWEKEWNVDQKKYISKVKDLGFDILEISCAMLKNISKDELLEMKKMAEDAGVMLTAGYGPNAGENLGSSDPAVVKNAIAFYTDILKKLEILDRIKLQLGWIQQGCYLVVDECSEHLAELEKYSWDEEKDKPEDRNDHTVNASQYSWIPYRNLIGFEEDEK